jgi:hypothetical protein
LVVLALFFHSIYEDLLKAAILKRLSAFMGIEEAELVSRLTEMAVPIVGAVAVVWFLYWYLKRELGAQQPDAAIEAQRQHTAAILAQTEVLKLSAPFIKDSAAEVPVQCPDSSDMWKAAPEAFETFADIAKIAITIVIKKKSLKKQLR